MLLERIFAFSIWKKIWREKCRAQTHLSKIKIFSPEIYPPHTWATLTKLSEPWIKQYGVGPYKYLDPPGRINQRSKWTDDWSIKMMKQIKLFHHFYFLLKWKQYNNIDLLHIFARAASECLAPEMTLPRELAAFLHRLLVRQPNVAFPKKIVNNCYKTIIIIVTPL